MITDPVIKLRRAARAMAMEISSRRMAYMKHRTLHNQAASITPAGNALVIAPHPDDEVLACGGLIAQKVAARERVDVLFMTRGEKSYECIDHAQSRHIGEVRTELAYRALDLLGVDGRHVHWQGFMDTEIPERTSSSFLGAALRLAQRLVEIRPDILFIPHQLDVHQDHMRTNKLVEVAFKLEPGIRSIDLYCYPTWMLHNQHPRHVARRIKGRPFWIDISSELSLKQKAIDLYFSSTLIIGGERKPYVGDLPLSFLSHFDVPQEMYFDMTIE